MKHLSDEDLSILAKKWLDGSIRAEERELFDSWYEKQPDSRIFLETREGDENAFREQLMARIRATTARQEKIRPARRWITKVAAAAVIILAIGISYYSWQREPVPQKVITQATYDLDPGGDKALLTLADGRKILLDTARAGQLASLGGSQVMQLGSGRLAIQANGASGISGLTGVNTLKTPNGGQYQIQLPDGTKVWLNAGSSIAFPSAFNGNTREVNITGEAYFEVVHDENKPFIVKTGKTVIRDIGTRFNVMAYADESVKKVTLQQGAVEVSTEGDNRKQLLTPGQQVQVTPTGKFTLIKKMDADAVTSWKEGRFNFQDANLQEVMRQLARWYDVEVIYKNGVPDLEFIGQVQRNLPLSEVLKGLRMSGVHFKLEEGRRLIVLSK